MSKAQNKVNGFTLVELLIASVIMGILATILVPTLLQYCNILNEVMKPLTSPMCVRHILKSERHR